MFSRTVAENRNGSSDTSADLARAATRGRPRAGRRRRSSTVPASGSYSRGSSIDQRGLARAGRRPRAPRSGRAPRRGRRHAATARRRRRRRSRRAAPRARRRPAAAGASGGDVICGARSSTSNTRAPEATARCAIPSAMPSIRTGRGEQHHVAVERDELADRDRAVDRLPPAHEQYRGEPEVRQEPDQRVVERAQPRRHHRLVEHPPRRGPEARELSLLLRERLHHANRRRRSPRPRR